MTTGVRWDLHKEPERRRRLNLSAITLLLLASIADAKPKMWTTCDKLVNGVKIEVSCEPPKVPPNPCIATCQKVREKQDVCTREERQCTRSLKTSKNGCTAGCDTAYATAAERCEEHQSDIEACKSPLLMQNASCWTICESTLYETSECISSRKTCQNSYDAAQDAKECKC